MILFLTWHHLSHYISPIHLELQQTNQGNKFIFSPSSNGVNTPYPDPFYTIFHKMKFKDYA